MTDRVRLDDLTSDQLDQLYDQLDRVRKVAARRSFMAGPNAVDVVRVADILAALEQPKNADEPARTTPNNPTTSKDAT